MSSVSLAVSSMIVVTVALSVLEDVYAVYVVV